MNLKLHFSCRMGNDNKKLVHDVINNEIDEKIGTLFSEPTDNGYTVDMKHAFVPVGKNYNDDAFLMTTAAGDWFSALQLINDSLISQ